MRNRALFISASVLAAMMAAPALAQDCSNVVYGKVATGYVLADMGIVGTDEPVYQGGFTRTCGAYYADIWVSVELNDGEFGNRGTGDEVDVIFGRRDSHETPIGVVNTDMSVAYYALAIDSLGTLDDDIVALTVDAGRPIVMGDLTVTPGLRVMRIIGVNDIDDLTLVRPYVQGAYRLNDRWTVSGDVGYARNITSDTDVLRNSVGIGYQATDNVSFSLRREDTDQTAPVWSVGFAVSF